MNEISTIQEETTDNGQNRLPLRIVIAGGGTGGHIFPALAIANALQKMNPLVEILFIGAKGKMEMEKIPEAGYSIKGLDISGFNRSSMLKNITLPFKLVKSYLQVRNIFRQFKPDAVIGVGGYSTFPVLRYAQANGIPSFIHEANSLGGRSNMALGKKALRIFTGSEGMEKYFPAEKILVTGNPVRNIFLEKAGKDEALRFFGLKPGRKTVLVFGGSLGAQSINEVIKANINVFAKNGLQLIWQTGKNFSAEAASLEEESNNMWTNAFISRMEYAYAAADIVIARAGAMTVAEMCVVEKACIFVPYPHAAEDHQTVNAMALVNRQAALIVPDARVTENLIPVMLDLASNENKLRELEMNIGKLAKRGVDDLIAAEILKTLGEKR